MHENDIRAGREVASCATRSGSPDGLSRSRWTPPRRRRSKWLVRTAARDIHRVVRKERRVRCASPTARPSASRRARRSGSFRRPGRSLPARTTFRLRAAVVVAVAHGRPSSEEVRAMGQPKSAKKKGRTVLEKRRIRREQQGAQVKRRRKSDRLDAASS